MRTLQQLDDDMDDKDDKDEMERTGTFVRDGEFKRKVNALRTIAQSEHETVDSETLQATSRIKIHSSGKNPVTRVQRALGRFKRS